MARFPGAIDPVGTITRADGGVDQHHLHHGQLTDFQVNAKEFLKGNGTTESSTQIGLLQTAAAGKRCVWPPGNYPFPDGVGFVTPAGSHHVGVKGATFVTVKDAYAFSGAAVGDIGLDGIFVTMRSGSTTGGAVKSSSGPVSGWRIRNMYCDGLPGITTPLYSLAGWIGCLAEFCYASVGQIGFDLDATGFSNSNTVRRCRANTQSVAAIRVAGEGNQLHDNIWESNGGVGVLINNFGFRTVVSGTHFEDCQGGGIYTSADTAGTVIRDNAFWSMGGASPSTTRYVKMTATSGHNSSKSVIAFNQFYNWGNASVEIGSGVEGTAILFNEGIRRDDGSLIDNGTGTSIFGNEATGGIAITKWDLDHGVVYGSSTAVGLGTRNGATGINTLAYATDDSFQTTSTATKLGFRGSTAITKPAVTGSRGGNAALASLLTALANQGLITDSSTA